MSDEAQSKSSYAPIIWLSIGFGAIIGAVLLFFLSCIRWLKWGVFASETAKDVWLYVGLEPQSTGWIGVDRIISFVANSPLYATLAIGGVLMAWWGSIEG